MKKIIPLLLLSSIIALPLHAANQPAQEKAGAEQVRIPVAPLHPALTQGSMQNGMQYLLLPNELPAGRMYIWLIVNAGSLDEDDDQLGVAHLVEHMLFNGTTRYPGNQMIDRMEQLGLKFGRDVNAFTEYRRTVYQISLPSDDPARIDEIFDMVQQWVSAVSFDPQELADERGVVVEEWRKGQNAQRRLEQQYRPYALAGSRHLLREPIGDMDNIRSVKLQRVVDFYQRWYQPSNMTLAVGGDFDLEAMRQRITTQFSTLAAKPVPARHYDGVAPHAQTRYARINDSESSVPSIELSYRSMRAVFLNNAERRDEIISGLMMALFNRRVQKALEDAGVETAAVVAAYNNTLADNFNSANFIVRLRENDRENGVSFLLKEMARVDQYGFTPQAYEHLRTEQISSLNQAARDSKTVQTPILMQGLLGWQRNGTPFMSSAQRRDWATAMLDSITLQDINQAWRTMRAGSDRLVVQRNVSAPLSEKEWEALEKNSLRLQMEAAATGKLIEMPAASLPAGSIVAERPLSVAGQLEWTLSNGARVLYVPSTNSKAVFLLNASSPRGRLAGNAKDYHAVNVAQQLLNSGSLAEFSRTDLQQWMTANRIGINAIFGDLNLHTSVNADVATTESAFKVLHQYFIAQHGRAPDWQRVKVALTEGIRNRGKEPSEAFSLALTSAIFADPRAVPLTQQMLDDMDLPYLQKLISASYANAGDYTFVLTSPEPAAKLRALVERYLASLPGHPSVQASDKSAYKPLQQNAKVAPIKLEFGLEPVAEVLIRFDKDDSTIGLYESYMSRIFIHALSTRLRLALREQASGVYGTQVSWKADPMQLQMSASIYFKCNPERSDELRTMASNELQKLLDEGIDSSLLESFRLQEKRRLELAAQRNETAGNNLLASYRMLGNDSLTAQQLQWLDTVDVASANRVMRSLLKDAKRVDAERLPKPAQP